MRALILGAGGMLARDLAAAVPLGWELTCTTHAELDVTRETAVTAAMGQVQPDVTINCAGYTAVDGAEADPATAFAVNGEAPGIIGRATATLAHRRGLRSLVVHFSTDYVFNGRSSRPYREEDAPSPLGQYGASKLAGERALLESGARGVIIRTSWLFGCHGKSFPRTMWQRARNRQRTRVVNDQVGRPTYTVDLARATWTLVGNATWRNGASAEVIHIANEGQATWYEIACAIFRQANAEPLVTPCTTAEYPTAARRPPYSVLDTTRHAALAGWRLPSWENALDRFLAQVENG